MGGHSGDGRTAAGLALLQAVLPEQVTFFSVPGARTVPGSMHLSTGAENKSLVNDASKETDRKSISQTALPALSQSDLPGSRSEMPACSWTSIQTRSLTCSLCHPLLFAKMLPQETAKLTSVGIT